MVRIGGQRFRNRQTPQNRKDIVSRGGQRRLKPGGAKLQHGAGFRKIPRQAGTQRHRAFKTLGGGLSRSIPGRGGRHMRIQHQQNAAIVVAREFSHHQRAVARRRLPVHVARAVGGHVIPQRVQVLPLSLGHTCQRALQPGKYLDELLRAFHRRIDQHLGFQIHAPRLLQETKRKTRHDAEGLLTIESALWKHHRRRLGLRFALGQVGKVHRRVKNGRRHRAFFGHRFHAQRKGRQREFFVAQFNVRADGLFGKNMFGQFQAQLHAGQGDGRKNSGHQNGRDQRGQNQKQ